MFRCGSVLKTSCSCASAARVGLMHIAVFILLLLSGERNFGVRLNKPYTLRVPMDIPVFTGTHADLLVVVRSPGMGIKTVLNNGTDLIQLHLYYVVFI